ncbi:hypothetical protein SprV_0200706100 [Sparganum proliferum]
MIYLSCTGKDKTFCMVTGRVENEHAFMQLRPAVNAGEEEEWEEEEEEEEEEEKEEKEEEEEEEEQEQEQEQEEEQEGDRYA